MNAHKLLAQLIRRLAEARKDSLSWAPATILTFRQAQGEALKLSLSKYEDRVGGLAPGEALMLSLTKHEGRGGWVGPG